MRGIEYFENRVRHHSAGGFVFYQSPLDGTLFVALVQKSTGEYLIPKGHIEQGETPEIAAVREIREELTLVETPRLIAKVGISTYSFSRPGDRRPHEKEVHLFVFSLPDRATISPQAEENFVSARWVEFGEALDIITFERRNLVRARQRFERK